MKTLALLLALAISAAQDAERPPSDAEVKKLVDAYLEQDGGSAEGRTEQAAILARLELLPALKPGEARTWRKRILRDAAEGPELETSPGKHALHADGSGPYLVFGKTSKPKGLLLQLHGSGPLPADAIGPGNKFNAAGSARDWVVVWPARPSPKEFWSAAENEAAALEVLEAALRTFAIDRDRVFLAGSSLGAIGSWSFAASHADRFAAIAPVAGGPLPPIEGEDLEDGIIPNLRNVAIVQYQAEGDPRTPVDLTRTAARKIDAARKLWGGYRFDYLEVPGTTHGPPAEGLDPVFSKVEDRQRDARPNKVVWQPMRAGDRHSYWLWWERPTSGAVIVAELDRKANTVRVESGEAAGFEVLLDDDLLDLDRDVVVLWNGAEAFRGVPARSLATLLKTAARGDAELAFDARIPLVRADGR